MTTTNKQPQVLHFQSLRREKKVTLQAIASAAGFSSPTIVYLFEIGAVVDHETKQRIIQAFSQITGESYTVSDFELGGEEGV